MHLLNERSKRLGLWVGLLLLSVVIHLLLSWQAGKNLKLPGSTPQETSVELDLSIDVMEAEEDKKLVFDEQIEFEPPSVLLATTALASPPPDINLALEAAAGGTSATLISIPVIVPVTQTSWMIEGAGQAGFGTGVGTGLSKSLDRYALYVQGLRETGLDVVFVVDATGSMDWVIQEVSHRIVDIVDAVRLLVPVSRFGIVAYRDHDDPEFVTRHQPLTFSLKKLNRFLQTLEAKGGGSWQEAVLAAMDTAASDMGWRVGAKQVVLLIGDAPPYDHNFQQILSVVKGIVDKGGQVSTLDVSHESNPAVLEASLGRAVNRALYRNKPMLHFQEIADAGDGVAATLEGDVEISRQLMSLIIGGQFQKEMALLLEGR